MTRLSSLRQRIPRGRMPSAKMPSTRFASNNKMLSGSHREDSLGAAAQGQLAGVRVASEVADAILQDLANQDEDNEKTYSRQIVEKYLMKVSNVQGFRDFGKIKDSKKRIIIPHPPTLTTLIFYYKKSKYIYVYICITVQMVLESPRTW